MSVLQQELKIFSEERGTWLDLSGFLINNIFTTYVAFKSFTALVTVSSIF
jgi:hypothetical protein